MTIKPIEGEIFMQRADEKTGINQIHHTFHSLEELFKLCTESDPAAMEGMVITGRDAHGKVRRITFAFRSITAASK